MAKLKTPDDFNVFQISMLNQMTDLRNIEMQISYRGTAYFGWQIQPEVPTVQRHLQMVLRRLFNQPELRIYGASRTDTGVHAHDQRVAFKTTSTIPLRGLLKTVNNKLPGDIRVLGIWERDPHFSVRYGAKGKHYTYFWRNRDFDGPFHAEYMAPVYRPMDELAMNDVCAHFIGTKCFHAFQSSRDHRESSETTVFKAQVGRLGDLVYFDILGHHFLYHMVRNMAKSLQQVGIGKWSASQWLDYFQTGDRRKMCVTAPAKGLHLFKVFYDEEPNKFSDQGLRFRELLARGLEMTQPWSEASLDPE